MFKKKDKEDNKNEKKKIAKEKKEKKKSPSFFSGLNADSTIEYGLAEKNPKSKWAKWTIAGLIGSVTIVGVAVPWSLSSCVVSLKKSFADSEIMYTYIDPITKKVVSVTYGEFERRVTASSEISTSVLEKWDEIFYRSVLESLYNEEREAYLKFKAIYEKLHKDDENAAKLTDFGADLSTKFSDIEKDKREILEKNKNSFKKATNSENWIQDWINELKTNSIYGPQSATQTTPSVEVLEEKAVAHMVSQQIKEASLARYYGASITTNTWNYIDYNFANTQSPGEEVYASYTDDKGKKIDIKKSEAVNIWKAYLAKGQNVVQPKNISESNRNKVAVFETKSYSTNFRNPVATITNSPGTQMTSNNVLIDMINRNFNLGLVSSVTISGIKPGEKNGSPFVITSDVIKSLFTVQNPNGNSGIANFVPFSRLSGFQGANLVNTSTDINDQTYTSNLKDDLIVKTFNTDESTNKTLGSSKLIETSSILQSAPSSGEGSESTPATLDMFGLAALTSFEEAPSSPINTATQEKNELFSINTKNPLIILVEILSTITKNMDNSLVFNGANPNYNYVQTNWDSLNYGSTKASPNLVAFVKLLDSNLNSKYEFTNTINASNFNTQLENAVSSLSEDDFAFMGKLLTAIMVGDKTDIKTNYDPNASVFSTVGYWTLYKLSNNIPAGGGQQANATQSQTYMYVSPEGIKIFSKSFGDNSAETLKSMVISDLNQTINVQGEETPVLYYDVASIFNKLKNDDLLILELLDDPKNQTTFKNSLTEYVKKEYPKLTEEEIKTKVDEIYTDFYSKAQLKFNKNNVTNISSIINNIPSSIQTLIDSGRVYDFATIIDNNTQEKLAAFQTQSQYNNKSVAQGQDAINSLFIEVVKNKLTLKRNQKPNPGGTR